MSTRRTVALALAAALLQPAPGYGWGWHVHSLVNRTAAASLPVEFAAFAQWTDSLASLASAADARRCCDDNEAPRHYIDIDDYEEFFAGTLPHTYDAMVARFGRERVIGNGIVPWAIETALAQLTEHLRSRDWPRAVAVAADIGHYVADSHQPLHLTTNYDGQETGQRGIHSRYESTLTEIYYSSLVPVPGSVSAYARPLDAVFAWIERVYAGVDQVLYADRRATNAAGGQTSGPVYYEVLWRDTGDLTRACIRDAALATAALWYTAWLDAGAPVLPGQGSSPPPPLTLRLLPNAPNPFQDRTTLRFELPGTGRATLRVLDVRGRLVRTLLDEDPGRGQRSLEWDGRDTEGRRAPSGTYRLRLEQSGKATERRAVRVR